MKIIIAKFDDFVFYF